jgi:valyl-tRNA synthetase
MAMLIDLIRGIRNVRAEYNVPPSRRIAALISGSKWTQMLGNQRETFIRLATLDAENLTIEERISEPPQQAAAVTAGGITAYLPLAGLVDLAAERDRLQKEADQLAGLIARSEGLLGNENYTSRAPTDVVQRERDKLDNMKLEHSEIEKRIAAL